MLNMTLEVVDMLDLDLAKIPTHELAEQLITVLGPQKAEALMLWLTLKIRLRHLSEKQIAEVSPKEMSLRE